MCGASAVSCKRLLLSRVDGAEWLQAVFTNRPEKNTPVRLGIGKILIEKDRDQDSDGNAQEVHEEFDAHNNHTTYMYGRSLISSTEAIIPRSLSTHEDISALTKISDMRSSSKLATISAGPAYCRPSLRSSISDSRFRDLP